MSTSFHALSNRKGSAISDTPRSNLIVLSSPAPSLGGLRYALSGPVQSIQRPQPSFVYPHVEGVSKVTHSLNDYHDNTYFTSSNTNIKDFSASSYKSQPPEARLQHGILKDPRRYFVNVPPVQVSARNTANAMPSSLHSINSNLNLVVPKILPTPTLDGLILLSSVAAGVKIPMIPSAYLSSAMIPKNTFNQVQPRVLNLSACGAVPIATVQSMTKCIHTSQLGTYVMTQRPHSELDRDLEGRAMFLAAAGPVAKKKRRIFGPETQCSVVAVLSDINATQVGNCDTVKVTPCTSSLSPNESADDSDSDRSPFSSSDNVAASSPVTLSAAWSPPVPFYGAPPSSDSFIRRPHRSRGSHATPLRCRIENSITSCISIEGEADVALEISEYSFARYCWPRARTEPVQAKIEVDYFNDEATDNLLKHISEAVANPHHYLFPCSHCSTTLLSVIPLGNWYQHTWMRQDMARRASDPRERRVLHRHKHVRRLDTTSITASVHASIASKSATQPCSSSPTVPLLKGRVKFISPTISSSSESVTDTSDSSANDESETSSEDMDSQAELESEKENSPGDTPESHHKLLKKHVPILHCLRRVTEWKKLCLSKSHDGFITIRRRTRGLGHGKFDIMGNTSLNCQSQYPEKQHIVMFPQQYTVTIVSPTMISSDVGLPTPPAPSSQASRISTSTHVVITPVPLTGNLEKNTTVPLRALTLEEAHVKWARAWSRQPWLWHRSADSELDSTSRLLSENHHRLAIAAAAASISGSVQKSTPSVWSHSSSSAKPSSISIVKTANRASSSKPTLPESGLSTCILSTPPPTCMVQLTHKSPIIASTTPRQTRTLPARDVSSTKHIQPVLPYITVPASRLASDIKQREPSWATTPRPTRSTTASLATVAVQSVPSNAGLGCLRCPPPLLVPPPKPLADISVFDNPFSSPIKRFDKMVHTAPASVSVEEEHAVYNRAPEGPDEISSELWLWQQAWMRSDREVCLMELKLRDEVIRIRRAEISRPDLDEELRLLRLQ